jgi:hypothetical protein
MMIFRPLLGLGLVLGLVLSLAPMAADAAAPRGKGPQQQQGKGKGKKGGHVHHGVVVKLDENTFAIKAIHSKKKGKTAAKVGANVKAGAKAGGAKFAGKKGKKGTGGHEFRFTKNTPGADKLGLGKHVLVKAEGKEAKEIKVFENKAKKKGKKAA